MDPIPLSVHRNGQLVLTFRTRPGVLLSSASRPPKFTPPAHPFVDAQAHDPASEHELAQLLRASSSPREFVSRLRRAGYEVCLGEVVS